MKEKVILKSVNPDQYPDLVIECRVIPNDQIGEYLSSIPDERKFTAYKSEPVKARSGKVGEIIKTTLKTVIDGREYILSEEESTVKERTYTREIKMSDGDVLEEQITAPDIVITNCCSTSNEEYVVKHQKFMSTYSYEFDGTNIRFKPRYDSRLLTQVDENVIIITAWGAPAVCLAGSFIVTYDAGTNDYNVIERSAFESTYTKEDTLTSTIRK